MKLSEIKPINEYNKGVLETPNFNRLQLYLNKATQERHHIVVKDDGPTAFLWLYKYKPNYWYYFLADSKTKKYYGHCFIEVSNTVMQALETYILSELRGNLLAPRLYAYISARHDKYIINANQLSNSAEKMWNKFPNKKIYNKEEDKFYDIDDPDAKSPMVDTDHFEQTWYWAFKETRKGILEWYNYLGPNFHYEEFLKGNPSFIFEDGESIHFTPMTPSTLI